MVPLQQHLHRQQRRIALAMCRIEMTGNVKRPAESFKMLDVRSTAHQDMKRGAGA